MPGPLRLGATEWALLLTLSVLWGGSFFFGAVAVVEMPPLTVALGRVGIAAAALGSLCFVRGLRLPTRLAQWRPYIVMAALNNLIPFSLILWGQTKIPSGLASILNATTPLFVVLLAHLCAGDERLSASRVIGVLVGLAGVTVMVGPAAEGMGSGRAGPARPCWEPRCPTPARVYSASDSRPRRRSLRQAVT